MIFVNAENTQSDSNFRLELVQVLFRHGDRTPETFECYPNDPHKNFDFKPLGRGQLTDQGKSRANYLGNLLRKHYDTFLGEYQPNDVYAYSTAPVRTKQSLQHFLKGLYPSIHKEQSIPTHSNSPKSDYFLQWIFCPELKRLLEKTMQQPKVKEELKKHEEFFGYLSNKTGSINVDVSKALQIHGTLRAQECCNLSLPDWYNEEIQNKFNDSVMLFFTLYSYEEDMKKITIGPILKDLLSNIITQNSKKINVYCVHDINIMLLLIGLGIQSRIKLDFGIGIVFEKLRGQDDQIYIRMKFYPGHGDEFIGLKLKDCDEICLYSKFLETVNSILPSEEELKSFYEGEPVNVLESLLKNDCT